MEKIIQDWELVKQLIKDIEDNSDDENRKLKLKSSFDTLKKMKRLKTRGKSNELVEAINMRAT